jgi:DHA1 family tetracycline resistance protein-like MFS transporter
VAVALAWFWLPETVHLSSAAGVSPVRAIPAIFRRPQLRRLLIADLIYWSSFAACTTTFALFASRRFGFDVTHTGYVLAGFGMLGVIVQAGLVGAVVARLGVLGTLLVGLVVAAAGWGLVSVATSVEWFLLALLPAGLGVGLCNASIVTLVSHSASKEEQGTVQGAAGALESLGRAAGPVWGHGLLQRFGEGSAYASAAAVFAATTFLIATYHPPAEQADNLP